MVLLSKTGLVLLRLKQVEQRVGFKSSLIYQKISEGTFPTQVQLGLRAVGWIESEIDAWIVAQVEKSRTVPVVVPMAVEIIPDSELAKQPSKNRIRTKQLGSPPPLHSHSTPSETVPLSSPPFASDSKGGRGDE